MIMVRWQNRASQGGTLPATEPTPTKGGLMRIHVYKPEKGLTEVFVVPGRAAHLPPILLKNVIVGNVGDAL